MRALWILIVVLVAGAVALALLPRNEQETVAAGTPITVPRRTQGTSSVSKAAIASAGGSASGKAAPSTPNDASVAPARAAPAAPPSEAAATPAGAAASAGESRTTGPRGGLADLGMDRTIPTATVARGELVRRPDGSILADGKWPIGGDGSPERPYEVTWDLLLSAKESYQPRLGEFVIPQRVALLDGAHVRISGYVAFPIVASEADECLLMLNQWDGCCIGVPPSPYDGIEAKLVRSQDNSRKHLFLYGTLTGVFHVDPFVQGKWLVGLYTMTEADLVTDL